VSSPPIRDTKQRMVHEFKLRRRVEFAETDMAGIMHFSNFFRFMEATEHAFFRSLGLELHSQRNGRMQGWVRVHASCDYAAPARYQDLLEVHLRVRDMTSNSISYSFDFRRVDEAGDPGATEGEPSPPTEIARGNVKVVCVSKGPDDARIQAVDMPREVARLVEAAPATP